MIAFLFFTPLLAAVISLVRWSPQQRRLWSLVCFLTLSLVWLSLYFARWEYPLVLSLGGWPHFAGISWVLDELGLVFCLSTILLYLPAAWALIEESREKNALFHFLVASLFGAFLTNDLFNLFVMFEILLLSSYALFFKIEKIRQARIFIWTNVIASSIFLFAIAFLYRSIGTVNFTDIAIRLGALPPDSRNLIFGSFAFVFILKAGIFPLSIWLPSSYSALPTRLLAFVAALSTKVGLYATVRLGIYLSPASLEEFQSLFMVLSLLTIILGVLGCIRSKLLKTALVYLGLAHVGFLYLIFSLPFKLQLEALLFYFIQDVIVVAGLFFLVADFEKFKVPTSTIQRRYLLAIPVLILLFSSSGTPPFSGFWGKWLVLNGSVESSGVFLTVLLAAASFFYASAHLWLKFFANPEKQEGETTSADNQRFRFSFETLYCLCLCLAISAVGFTHPRLFKEPADKLLNRESQFEKVVTESMRIQSQRELEKESREVEVK